MSFDPLHPSRENVKRAQRKFDDLKSAVNRFAKSAPFVVRMHREGDLIHVIARREKDIPEDLAFDTVEVVGRLRAALDKAVVALVTKNGRGTSGVGFPFGGIDRNTWQALPFPNERIIDGLKKKLTADQWAFIEAQRPYPRGNDALWAINEIANEDKHRTDLVTVKSAFASQLGPGPMTKPGETLMLDHLQITPPYLVEHIIADQERESILFSIGPKILAQIDEKKMEHQLAVSIVFGPVVPVFGRNILITLGEQIQLTAKIINGFAQLI